MTAEIAIQEAASIVRQLNTLADPESATGLARFDIRPGQVLGIKIPVLQAKAEEFKQNHDLALALWQTGLHKAQKWSAREPEFVKRAGFALMAYPAIHDKKSPLRNI